MPDSVKKGEGEGWWRGRGGGRDSPSCWPRRRRPTIDPWSHRRTSHGCEGNIFALSPPAWEPPCQRTACSDRRGLLAGSYRHKKNGRSPLLVPERWSRRETNSPKQGMYSYKEAAALDSEEVRKNVKTGEGGGGGSFFCCCFFVLFCFVFQDVSFGVVYVASV